MRKNLLLTILVIVLTISICMLAYASQLPLSTTVVGGTLSDSVSSLNVNSVTLTGKDGVTANFTPTADWRVCDARGSGAGWQVTVSATEPTTGTRNIALSNLRVTVTNVAKSGDALSSSDPALITRASNLPMDTSATLVQAAVYQGMGSFVYSPEFALKIPASAYAGTYSSNITTTIFESGPST